MTGDRRVREMDCAAGRGFICIGCSNTGISGAEAVLEPRSGAADPRRNGAVDDHAARNFSPHNATRSRYEN